MEVDFYVLFANNTDAMMMDAALRHAGVRARISPTPYDLQKKSGCGIAILISPAEMAEAQKCIDAQELPHMEIVRLARQINPQRDRFM